MKISGVPVYGQESDDVDDDKNEDNCGPTTGAMIVDYYRLEEDFDDFDSWADNHDALYDDMRTNKSCWPLPCPGTPPAYFASGWENYTSAKGYDFDADPDYPPVSWNSVVSSIDDDRPMAVMFAYCSDAPDWHWNAVTGYGIWVDSNDNEFEYLLTNDPAGKKGYETFVNWEANDHCLALVDLEED